jgi:hypothetical protein
MRAREATLGERISRFAYPVGPAINCLPPPRKKFVVETLVKEDVKTRHGYVAAVRLSSFAQQATSVR